MSSERGLADLTTPTLEALLSSVERGTLACPLTTAGLQSNGFGANAALIASVLRDANHSGVAAAIRIALAERSLKRVPVLDLVWTGPESALAHTRDTAVVVRQLFSTARTSVLVAGYSFDHGEDLLRPLHEGMKDRGVTATFFVDIDGHAAHPSQAHAYATDKIDRFFADNWPFGPPRPDVYYDPRTAAPGPPWASLHAKVVVVDMRVTLIGSANFTERGQERNIEAGVMIEDEGFAERMVGQWRRLIEGGLVRRYGG